MKLEKIDLNKHDTYKVSKLIYETDATLFDFFYRDKHKAIQKIERLVRAGNNTMGYERIMVVTPDNNNQVRGVLLYSCGQAEENEINILLENLNCLDVLKFKVMDWLEKYFLTDLKENDFYLASLAVNEKCRGKGIGSFIIQKALMIAKEYGFERAVLDVDIDNKGAYKLYKRLGFTIFNKKSINWFNNEKGVFHMECKLK